MELLLILLLIAYLIIYTQKPSSTEIVERNSVPFTLVVPFKNEEPNIRNFIQSLHRCHLDDMSVVFVNDGSTDRSEEVLQQELEKISGLHYQILHAKGEGKLKAIALALDYTDSDWLVVLDADTEIGPDTLNVMASPNTDDDAVFVPVRVAEVSASHSDFQQLEYMAMNATSSIFSKNNIALLNSSAAMGMSRSYWEKFAQEQFGHHGPFDAELSAFLMRESSSVSFWDQSSAVVQTQGEQELESFVLQRKKWGVAAIKNWRLILYFLFIYTVNTSVILGLFYGRIGRFYLLAKLALDVFFFMRWQGVYGFSFTIRQLVINALLYTPYILIVPFYGAMKPLISRFTRR